MVINIIEEINAYKCVECGEKHEEYVSAVQCEYRHVKERLANALLKDGFTLNSINYQCGFNWNLTDKQEKVTKDNCFTISYLQCCKKPAYKITYIDSYGNITVCGKGSWSGYYSSIVELNKLRDPRPLSELYLYE